MKFYIYKNFLGGIHYVWCSEFFDARKQPAGTIERTTPASSNPAEIYERLRAATLDRPDHGDVNIQRWREGLKTFAADWIATNTITA